MTRRPAQLASLAALLLVGPLAGCSVLSGPDDATGGAIVQVDQADRRGPVDIAGSTLQGDELDLADLRGEVVVLNVWGSWCVPCRTEAPRLQEASETIAAEFVGLSFEDLPDNARAFEDQLGITYPTIADDAGQVLALGRYAPTAAPTTYVLDRLGRVAAVLTGEVKSLTTLEDLVEQVASENGSSG